MSIVVACRRSPQLSGEPFRACRAVQLTPLPIKDVRAKRGDRDPDARGYKGAVPVELRADELAGVVGIVCRPRALALEYATLIARAFAGAVVVDGEIVFEASEPELAPLPLAVAWRALDRRPLPRGGHGPLDRDWSSI